MVLREADAAPVTEVAKKHGISEQTIYQWRKRFGKLEPADVKRLRHLEQENAKLKKLVAERDLEIDVMKRKLPVKVTTDYWTLSAVCASA
jgi:putative transposase